MTRTAENRLWTAIFIVYTASTFAVSLLPGRLIRLPKLGVRADLVLHALEYGLLAWITLCFLRTRPRPPRAGLAAALAVGFAVAVGGANELVQAYAPGRYSSWSDVWANLAGAALAVSLASIHRKRPGHFAEGG